MTAAVDRLKSDGRFADLVDDGAKQLASIFENMFCHHRFTGRSGTFFAYEGLGSIYWHMVSKLLLAIGENYIAAEKAGDSDEILARLKQHFREVQSGIGAEKSPNEYGAFPTDPYSHTPEHAGAQQPGMTGQVKEDILSRFMELGLRVASGSVSFEPSLLDPRELSQESHLQVSLDEQTGELTTQELAGGTFAFSICGVPVVYREATSTELTVFLADGKTESFAEAVLNREYSEALFSRSGEIIKIELAYVPEIYS